MLDQLFDNPAYQALAEYLSCPETRVAVLLPGVVSLAILAFYARAGKLSRRLQAKTEVRRARRGGTITIRFGSEEELIRIYDQLMGKKYWPGKPKKAF